MKLNIGNQLIMTPLRSNMKTWLIVCLFIIFIVSNALNKGGTMWTLYYNNTKTKKQMICYCIKDNRIDGALFVNNTKRIKEMNDYYTGKSESIDFMNGYITPYKTLEVVYFDYKDSTAVVKLYNSSLRMTEFSTVFVSLKCLHYTLPNGSISE